MRAIVRNPARDGNPELPDGPAPDLENSSPAGRAADRKPKMKTSERLAVCSWSLRPESPAALAADLKSVGILRVQLALDPLRDNPQVWGDAPGELARAGIPVISGMFGMVGEDYSTLESIKRTGGVVPDADWETNWANIRATADLAARMRLPLVTFHAGFLPHEESDPAFTKVFDRVARIADLFAENGIALAMETGQETADTLAGFLRALDRPNVGVNFDPANMILYGKGDPVDALRILGPWLRQCHIKDAVAAKQPGGWGEEVVVGTGDVAWDAFFRTLDDLGYSGNLVIEREAGETRAEDIRAAARVAGSSGRPAH
jgi:sugar phosphate isomerase/epimerase